MADTTLPTPDIETAPGEQWRPIGGYEGVYWISSHGRVYSVPRAYTKGGVIARGIPNLHGYLQVRLYRDGGRRVRQLHQLVTEAFIGPQPEEQHVRHLDGDKLNNRLDNLAYGTPSENTHDLVRHGTHNNARKTGCPWGHPYSPRLYPRTGGGFQRICLTCIRERRRRRKLQHDGAA